MAPRRSAAEASLLERTLIRFELYASDSALATVVSRAFALAVPPRLATRELQLLHLADEVASVGSLGLRDHARLYLALAAASWTRRDDMPATAREAAAIVAVALASRASVNLRTAMGVRDELARIGQAPDLEDSVRALAGALGSSGAPPIGELERILAAALAALETRIALNTPIRIRRVEQVG